MGMGGVGYMFGGIHVGRIREVRVGTLNQGGTCWEDQGGTCWEG